jgi:hypothetical protein
VKKPERKTISRRSDEPQLEIGAVISIKEGVVGVVLARYTPSGRPNEISLHFRANSNEIVMSKWQSTLTGVAR